MLFRGQINSSWNLKTTLERKVNIPMMFNNYYWFAMTAKPKIETFNNIKWVIPNVPEFIEWLENRNSLSFYNMPAYDYLGYLRHHGFPSPFLDWTMSPYIALYFAFNNCDASSSDNVAVYCYLEQPGVGKITGSDKPFIYVMHHYHAIHPRHFLQQSKYSLCVRIDDHNQIWFDNHEDVINENDPNQDRLWKFSFPARMRNEVLKYLHQMNINSYSLFGTNDSLIESIATNEIINGKLIPLLLENNKSKVD